MVKIYHICVSWGITNRGFVVSGVPAFQLRVSNTINHIKKNKKHIHTHRNTLYHIKVVDI
jgi:hypothetical protein